MNTNTMVSSVTDPLATFINGFVVFIPNLIVGLIILIIGLFIASSLKKGMYFVYDWINLDKWIAKGDEERKKSLKIWEDLFAELVRWTIVVLFLVPAVEAWGIPRITDVLNRLLLYIPNVFVAAIIGLVGAVAAHFVADIVRNGAKAIGSKSAKLLSNISYYAVVFFTVLVVLNQLGIASDLIQILFTGIIAMLAIAGGLAFGLGGQDMAKELLQDLRKKLK